MKIKYLRSNIVFQEIPGEISLSFEITNCPYCCHNCHSPELQEDIGIELTVDVLRYYIEKNKINNKMLISCVLFMGGDQHPELLDLIKVVKEYNLKTALYTGSDDVDIILKNQLDYLKTGPYIKEFGDLRSKNTNQRLYKIVGGIEVSRIELGDLT